MQLFRALIAQLLGLLAAWGLHTLAAGTAPWSLVATQAVTAALASRWLRQPLWWAGIHLAFAPAALLLLTLQLPAWLYLVASLLMALVFWGTVTGDVPLFLSSTKVSAALLKIVDQEQADSFIDLGAGLGSVVVPLARGRPGLAVEAWERAPIPWLVTALRCRHLRDVAVYRKSFWQCDLSVFAIVFAFLSPSPMPALGDKARREMRPGTLLVSSTFALPDWEPESVITLEDSMDTRLYCYRIPA